MTDIVAVPDVVLAPDFPTTADRQAGVYNSKAKTWADGENAMATSVRDIAVSAFTNATAAKENGDAAVASAASVNAAAATATTKAAEASASASAAATSATNASTSATAASKLNLGDKSSPPSTDNQGAALRAGATYFDTTLTKWRVWTGTAWGDGISTVAGVSSLNGQTGDLVKTTLAGYGITDGVTLSGTQTLENKTIKGVVETGPAEENAGAAYTVNLANGSIIPLTLNANCTFTFPTQGFGKQFTLLLKQSGAFTYALPASHRMDDGVTLPVVASGKTATLSFISDGTYWLCYVGGKGHTRA